MNGPRTNLRLTIAPETPIDTRFKFAAANFATANFVAKMDGLNPTKTAGMPSHASRIGA